MVRVRRTASQQPRPHCSRRHDDDEYARRHAVTQATTAATAHDGTDTATVVRAPTRPGDAHGAGGQTVGPSATPSGTARTIFLCYCMALAIESRWRWAFDWTRIDASTRGICADGPSATNGAQLKVLTALSDPNQVGITGSYYRGTDQANPRRWTRRGSRMMNPCVSIGGFFALATRQRPCPCSLLPSFEGSRSVFCFFTSTRRVPQASRDDTRT